MATVKLVEKYTGAFWIILIISIPLYVVVNALFGKVGLVIAFIVFIFALQSAKKFYICSSCGNPIEKTSNMCPTCKERIEAGGQIEKINAKVDTISKSLEESVSGIKEQIITNWKISLNP